ncbi:hypothetical protein I4U23_011587 [Adineta vaga]|nr:hypothetical protein I4U23_011587 [Adineta vaga]
MSQQLQPMRGYRSAALSGNFAMHNANGTRFSFDSMNLYSTWYGSIDIKLTAYRSGQITSGGTFKTIFRSSLWINCGFYENTDTITLVVGHGVMHE